jgi:hypothetical protein
MIIEKSTVINIKSTGKKGKGTGAGGKEVNGRVGPGVQKTGRGT